MAKRVSPATIGVFVVASLAILVVAVVIVGSGRLFRKQVMFVCMFEGDLNGLKVGSPVKVRGVQIGTVSSIRLRLSPSEGRLRPNARGVRLPVVIEIDRSQIVALGGTGGALRKAGYEALIQQGLRAQLKVESVLTGLLYIDLDLHSGAPLDLVLVPGSGPYPEIPTVPTTMEAVQEQATKALARFEEIDFTGLILSITQAANSFKNLAASPDLKLTLESVRESTATLNRTLTSVRSAVANANGKLGPLVAGLTRNSQQVDLTLKQTRAAIVALQSTLSPDSPLAVHLNEALDRLSDTAQSVQELSDYLQQNPSSLIRGRYVPDKER
ncbi:MAG: MlaD family protein [Candidatus Binataceae bacterium]